MVAIISVRIADVEHRMSSTLIHAPLGTRFKWTWRVPLRAVRNHLQPTSITIQNQRPHRPPERLDGTGLHRQGETVTCGHCSSVAVAVGLCLIGIQCSVLSPFTIQPIEF